MIRKAGLSAGVMLFLLAFSASSGGESHEPASRYADFDGVKLHYYSVGSDTTALLFVHGWVCSADFWKKSISQFPGRRVIAVDLPGHGSSDKPITNYTFEYMARGIEAVMRDAKVDRAVLVGHSIGVRVSREFYRLYPRQTLGLVMVDGVPWVQSVPKQEVDRVFAPLLENYRENTPKYLDVGLLSAVHDENLRRDIRRTMLATPDYVGRSIVQSVAMEAQADERPQVLASINVPVLAILADSQQWRSDTESVLRSIAPALDFQAWQGVSHFLMLERPAAFNDSVKRFISKNALL